VSDLVRLLGYRLSPAVGGRATFAFELKKDEPVTLPAGFPLKANLEDLDKPSDFETLEETTLYPWLGRFNLYRALEDGDITPSTTEFYISSPEQLTDPIDLKVGDRLLIGQIVVSFYPDDGAMWDTEVVIVDSIREQHGRKYYTIKGNLKRITNISSLSVYRLGRSFHHFGYNSPAKIVDGSAAVTSTAVVNTTTNTTTTTSTVPYLTVKRDRTNRDFVHTFERHQPAGDTAVSARCRDKRSSGSLDDDRGGDVQKRDWKSHIAGAHSLCDRRRYKTSDSEMGQYRRHCESTPALLPAELLCRQRNDHGHNHGAVPRSYQSTVHDPARENLRQLLRPVIACTSTAPPTR
jgi:hypothetical protein